MSFACFLKVVLLSSPSCVFVFPVQMLQLKLTAFILRLNLTLKTDLADKDVPPCTAPDSHQFLGSVTDM